MSIFTYIRKHSVITTIIAVLAVIIMIIVGRMVSRSGEAINTGSEPKRVNLIEASAFRADGSVVFADGAVESVSQADLKSQVSAPIATINAKTGDYVYAGQVIAELQNSDIRAQLEQAKASLNLAKGQFQSGGVSLESARQSAVDAIKDSFVKADDTLHANLDRIILRNSAGNLHIYTVSTDAYLTNKIRTQRIDLANSFDDWTEMVDELNNTTSHEAVLSALKTSEDYVNAINDLLNDIARAINDASVKANENVIDTLNEWKTLVSAGRTSISTASQSLTSAEGTLISAMTSSGTQAPAQVAVAEAGVKNLEAQLAKTIIRSPISGTVGSVPFHVGELISPGELITTIVGGGGLKIRAYASSEDLGRLKSGSQAVINGQVQGIVESVAPSINQANKKIEVNVRIVDPQNTNLVVGENVQVRIDTDSSGIQNSNADSVYLLPIQNVKIVPGEAYVYTVDAENKIVSNDVTLGEVRGDFVEVKSGLRDSMNIVSPVYELNPGEIVRTE